jgi:hypothetical protein
MRDFPNTGAGHQNHHEMLPRDCQLLGSFGNQGFSIASDSYNSMFVDGDKLPEVRWVVLYLGRALSPFKIVCHSQLEHCLWANMHGLPSTRCF